VLLAAKADPNAADNEGRTPLDYVTRDLRADVRPLPPRVLPPGAPVAIASTVRPKPVLSPRQSELANVLRKGGANEWAPRPGQITVARRGADVASPVFRKGTYDNQFTLFELLAASAADWPFPDYSRVTISRLNATTSKMEEIPLDVAGALAAGDCARDVPLRWGDLVDLPEREHGLNESSLGLPVEFAQALAKCLERTVKVTVKRQMKQLPLKVEPKEVARAAFPGGGRGGYSISSPDFWLSPVLRNSGLLLTSSDLSRVKVKRVDPATGDRREWVVDLDRLSAPNDLWLRDGDLVEVPEK